MDWTILYSKIRKLTTALTHKADLVNNKVPLSQLPDFVVAQVITVQTYADLPATGDSGYVYNVVNDPDTSKNGAYKWIGTGYFKYTNEQNYYSVSIVGASYTMGQLETAVNNINLAGQHVFFDLHEFSTDAYVCLVHFTSGNHCTITDVLTNKIYGIGQTYTSEQTVSNYVQSAVLDLTNVQSKNDNALLTTNKTVVGAINELFGNKVNKDYQLIAETTLTETATEVALMPSIETSSIADLYKDYKLCFYLPANSSATAACNLLLSFTSSQRILYENGIFYHVQSDAFGGFPKSENITGTIDFQLIGDWVNTIVYRNQYSANAYPAPCFCTAKSNVDTVNKVGILVKIQNLLTYPSFPVGTIFKLYAR